MLRLSTVDAVRTLSTKLTNGNRVLIPGDNTPLAMLVSACIPAMQSESGPQVDLANRLMDASSKPGLDGVVLHDKIMEESLSLATEAVRGILNKARNIITPAVKDILADTDKRIAEMALTVNQYNIEAVHLNKVFDNPVLAGITDKFMDQPSGRQVANITLFKEQTHEEILELVKTGVQRLDEEVLEMIGGWEPGRLVEVFNVYFRSMPRKLNIENDEELVVALLIVKRVMDNVPDILIADLDLLSYKRTMSEQFAGLAQAVARINLQQENNLRNLRLIKSMPPSGSYHIPIRVNGNVYNKWLNGGGTPEVLMGAVVHGYGSYMTYNYLLEQKDNLLETWRRHERLATSRLDAERITVATKSVRDAVMAYIDDLEGESEKVSASQLKASVREWLVNNPLTTNRSLYKYIQLLVCEVLYPDETALRVLNQIDSICEADKEISPREAGTLAVIDIVSDWVATMFHVELARKR